MKIQIDSRRAWAYSVFHVFLFLLPAVAFALMPCYVIAHWYPRVHGHLLPKDRWMLPVAGGLLLSLCIIMEYVYVVLITKVVQIWRLKGCSVEIRDAALVLTKGGMVFGEWPLGRVTPAAPGIRIGPSARRWRAAWQSLYLSRRLFDSKEYDAFLASMAADLNKGQTYNAG